MKLPKAFIFDLDGVITDTAEYHYLAWRDLAAEMGIIINRDFNESLKGVGRMDSLERIIAYGGKKGQYTFEDKEALAAKKNEYYKKLIETMGPENILPNIIPFLRRLKQESIFIGLASASRNAFRVIELLEVGGYFDYIADANKVLHSKPAPDVFIDVMNHFRLGSDKCIGIEDAAAGIEAIKAAKMFAVGIGKRVDLPKADLLFESTINMNFDGIISAYNR